MTEKLNAFLVAGALDNVLVEANASFGGGPLMNEKARGLSLLAVEKPRIGHGMLLASEFGTAVGEIVIVG